MIVGQQRIGSERHRVTIREVAQEAGVAVVSVSRALNDQPGVSEETRRRIVEAAERLDYHPNRHARFLKLGSNRAIAVMMKGIDNPFFQQMLETMETATRERDRMLSIIKVAHHEDEVEEAIKLVDEDAVSGIIFLGGSFTHEPHLLQHVPVPFVLSTVGNLAGVPRDEYSAVTVDDVAESRRVVEHLIALGHRRIAVIGVTPEDISIGRMRSQGYLDALTGAGLPVDEDLIRAPGLKGASPFSMRYGYELARDLIRERPDATAIFAEADVMAVGALKAVLEAGLRVPEDISIAGFDGIPLTEYVQPSLTTLVQPADRIAQLTCDILFDQLAGAAPRYEVVPGELRVAGSTAPPREDRQLPAAVLP